MVALKLSKVWHVEPDKVLKTRTDLVMAALVYEKFLGEYEEKSLELIRENNGNN